MTNKHFVTILVPNIDNLELLNSESFKDLKLPVTIRAVSHDNIPGYIAPELYEIEYKGGPSGDINIPLVECVSLQRVDNWNLRSCAILAALHVTEVIKYWEDNTEDKIVRHVTNDILETALNSKDGDYSHDIDNWKLAARNIERMLRIELTKKVSRVAYSKNDRDSARSLLEPFVLKTQIAGAFYNLCFGRHDSFAKVIRYVNHAKFCYVKNARENVTRKALNASGINELKKTIKQNSATLFDKVLEDRAV